MPSGWLTPYDWVIGPSGLVGGVIKSEAVNVCNHEHDAGPMKGAQQVDQQIGLGGIGTQPL